MLDQNTDRMWYVIGAVIVGAALIFLVNSSFPQLFASVGTTFESKVEDVSGVISTIGSDTTVANPNLIKDSTNYAALRGYYDSTFTYSENVTVPEWNTKNAVRIKSTGGTSEIKVYRNVNSTEWVGEEATLSVYVKNMSRTSMHVQSNGTGEGWLQTVAPGELKRIVLTGNVRLSYNFVQFIYRTDKVSEDLDIVVYGMKIEKGSAVTDYIN